MFTFLLLIVCHLFIWHCIFKGHASSKDVSNLGYGGKSRYILAREASHVARGKFCPGGLKGWRALCTIMNSLAAFVKTINAQSITLISNFKH